MCPENRYSDEVFLDPNKLIREDEEEGERRDDPFRSLFCIQAA